MWGVSPKDIKSARRYMGSFERFTPPVVPARHYAWKRLRERGLTLTQIGQLTGHDHSSVSVALRK